MAQKLNLPSAISGLKGRIGDLFKGGKDDIVQTKTPIPSPSDIQPNYPFADPIDRRLTGLADWYYREGSFEKIQFARKWMRNALMFQGYHELEWSEINVAWDIILQDSGDYAFPNNYYRSLIYYGVAMYCQNAPIIEPVPANDGPGAEAASKAARGALEYIKEVVKYDYLRVLEAFNLRLMGNSFRFSYFSKDPRFGTVTAPVYKNQDVVLNQGGSMCPQCGPMEGSFGQCPACGSTISEQIPPVIANLPIPSGTVEYPRGEIVTECVSPLEIYIRSSSYDLWHAPFLIRNRVVDRLALQSAYPEVELIPKGDEGGGEAYATGGDLSLIYLQTLADLPGDPTQFAAWYERATAAAKSLLVEAWLRPSLYFFDKELIKKFPHGLYIAKTGDTLLEARDEEIEDHWTHYVYTPVPGRIWGDGDDDLIPKQLLLDETDRLIYRNQSFASAPLILIDSQRIDKNTIVNDPSTIIQVRPAGRPISEAHDEIESMPLSAESWQWRMASLSDMQFHARVSPVAVGQHQPGTDTYGGQEAMASRSDQALLPNMMLWKTADEMWARQVLKLAAENWLDPRVHQVMGIDGKWEFQKLQKAALDMDNVKIITRAMPVDPVKKQAFSEAVAAGLLNPQDPRVLQKAIELYDLPTDVNATYQDQKMQWKEIEKMKETGQQIQPVLLRDNDQVHIDICRSYLNSDIAEENPQLSQLVWQHMTLHVMNMAKQQEMAAMVQGAAQGPQQPQQPGQPGQGGPRQPERRGGQVPHSAVTREQRARKAEAGKPSQPQPPSGNQYRRRRMT